MTVGEMTPEDLGFLRRAIEESARSLDHPGLTPFGAVVVIGGRIVAAAASSVVRRRDATAHAEVLAIRAAGRRTGGHLLPEATLYCSGSPCPLCLAACYWARIPRVVFGATLADAAAAGFEDLAFFEQLALPPERRGIELTAAPEAVRRTAVAVLERWHLQHPGDPAV